MKYYHLLLLAFIPLLILSCELPFSKNYYVVGIQEDLYSLPIKGKEQNVLAFLENLLEELAKDSKIALVKKKVSKYGQNTDCDFMLTFSSTQKFHPRDKILSKVILTLSPVLVVRKDGPIQSLDDMDEKILGVQTRSSLIFDKNLPQNIIIKHYTEIREAVEELVNTSIDGLVLEYFQAHTFLKSLYKQELQIIDPPLVEKGFYLLANRQEKEVLKNLEKSLERLKTKGLYQELLKKWKLSPQEPTNLPTKDQV